MRAVMTALWFLSATPAASLPEAPLIGVQALISDGVTSDERRRIDAAVDAALESAGVRRLSSRRLARALRHAPELRCALADRACLAALARRLGSSGVLQLRVDVAPVTLSGRLVREDAALLWAPELVWPTAFPEARAEALDKGLSAVLSSLPQVLGRWSSLDRRPAGTPPAAVAPKAVALDAPTRLRVTAPTAARPTLARPTPATPIPIAPIALGSVGLAALGGGVALQLGAAETARRFEQRGLLEPVGAAEIAELRGLKSRHATQNAASVFLLAAGGLMLAGSAAWMLGVEAPSVRSQSDGGRSGSALSTDAVARWGTWP